MTALDVQHILANCDLIKEYIYSCRKSKRKISEKFIFSKGKSIMDYAYQCHCFSNGRIPVHGVYEI